MKIEQEQIKKYIEYLDIAKYSNNVKNNYGYYIHNLLGKEIDQDTINSLCNDKHTVYRSFLKTVLKCFKLEQKIVVPVVRGRKEEKEIIYFTQNEMKVILDNVKDIKLHIIIRLMYEDGLRISEVLNLQKRNFDIVNHRVRGIGKGRKEFNMKLRLSTFKLLLEYMDCFENEDYIFHYDNINHQRQKALYEIKKIIGELLPYKNKHHIFCHAFRHSCGTHLREEGFDLREIQTYLRHKQLETVASYTAIDKLKLEKKIEDMDNLMDNIR